MQRVHSRGGEGKARCFCTLLPAPYAWLQFCPCSPCSPCKMGPEAKG